MGKTPKPIRKNFIVLNIEMQLKVATQGTMIAAISWLHNFPNFICQLKTYDSESRAMMIFDTESNREWSYKGTKVAVGKIADS